MNRRDEAYTAFVSQRWGRLLRLAELLAPRGASGEDLLQTALMRTYVAWDRVQRTELPDAYVRRILVNTAINETRTRQRRPEVLEADVPERVDEARRGAEERALDERDNLWPRIEALPPRQRAVIVLRYYEDLTEAEIAEVLGCARGTVKSTASAALLALRISTTDPAGDPPGVRAHRPIEGNLR